MRRITSYPTSSSLTRRLICRTSTAASAATTTLHLLLAIPRPHTALRFQSSSSSDQSSQSSQSSQSAAQQAQRVAIPSWTDPTAKDMYTRLGLRKDATTDDIKKHYRHLAKKYHPDQNQSQSATEKEANAERFRQVKEAYETLSSTDKRKIYDQSGFTSQQQQQPGFDQQYKQYSRFYQWSGSNVGGGWNVGVDPATGRVRAQVPRTVYLLMLFTVGLAVGAAADLRRRRARADDARKQQLAYEQANPNFGGAGAGWTNTMSSYAALAQERSSMLRPLVTIFLCSAMLPRLPAAVLIWYWYCYRPTTRAEDRAALDNVVVTLRDEMNGAAFNVGLGAPLLQHQYQNTDSTQYLMTVAVRPTADPEGSGAPVVEYPAGKVNQWSMSVPKPRNPANMNQVLPTTATVRVKRVTVDGNGRFNADVGEVVFEGQVRV